MAFPGTGQHGGQLDNRVRCPGSCLGWRGQSENQEHRNCHGSVGSGLGGGAAWEEQATSVCSNEHLRKNLGTGRGTTG